MIMASKPTLRTCTEGHEYLKSSDCPICPICETNRKPKDGFLHLLGAPARRALEGKGITTIGHLSRHSEKELLKLHGFGKSSLPPLRKFLAENGLTFKQ